jgi:hypothetical protein
MPSTSMCLFSWIFRQVYILCNKQIYHILGSEISKPRIGVSIEFSYLFEIPKFLLGNFKNVVEMIVNSIINFVPIQQSANTNFFSIVVGRKFFWVRIFTIAYSVQFFRNPKIGMVPLEMTVFRRRF